MGWVSRGLLSRLEAARALGRFPSDSGKIQICFANLGFLPSLRSKLPYAPILALLPIQSGFSSISIQFCKVKRFSLIFALYFALCASTAWKSAAVRFAADILSQLSRYSLAYLGLFSRVIFRLS